MQSNLPHRRVLALSMLLLTLGCIASIAHAAQDPLLIYVSPDGNDQFTGALSHTNADRTDGPFATPARARDFVRNLRKSNDGKLLRPINILFRGGAYFLHAPLQLTPADSGTADCPITWVAFETEHPVLSGGRPVRGWTKATLNNHDVWAAHIADANGSFSQFHELWVNNQRRRLARSPNKGYFLAGEVPDLKKDTKLQDGQTRFHYIGDDLKNWPNVADADIILLSLWAESHLPVVSVDEHEHLVNVSKATVHKMTKDDKYFVEGAPELLDDPGEWYFDRKTSTLYYLPMPGEGMADTQVIVPWLHQVVQLAGQPDDKQFIEYVNFRGLTFAHSEWYIPRDGQPPLRGMKPAGFNQAAWGVPGVITADGLHHCIFDSCTIAHAGNYGIELRKGCQNNAITSCTLTDLGAGGIKIGETAVRNTDSAQTLQNEVSDTTIADCSQIFPSAIGIWIGQSPKNLITHNDIHGQPYTGISTGWTWGYGNALAHDNIIEYNHVHHIGTIADGADPILSDMAGIYTLGKSPGSIIRFNRFHDIAGLRYGGWGIYFDEGTSDILAENNLVYRTTHGGFHQHYGQNNTVHNNIFAFAREWQIQRSRIEDHLSFTFDHNIVLWNQGILLGGKWAQLNAAFDHNTYWPMSTEPFKCNRYTWQEWQKAGMDTHSQIHDPGFVDPLHDDFHLKPGAEKSLDGFVPFDVSTAGPRKKQ